MTPRTTWNEERQEWLDPHHPNQRGQTIGQTVAENLCLASLKGKRVSLRAPEQHFVHQIALEILKPFELGLEHKLDVPMSQLSGGQRQIIAFVTRNKSRTGWKCSRFSQAYRLALSSYVKIGQNVAIRTDLESGTGADLWLLRFSRFCI